MFIKRRNRPQQGLTLIELVMFIVIVSLAVVGVMQSLGLANRLGSDPVRRKQALAIAESLLEEVQLAKFTYCDPTDDNALTATQAAVGALDTGCTTGLVEALGQESGGSGRPYDNINDYITTGSYGSYDGAAFNTGGVLADVNGNAILPGAGFTASLKLVADETFNGIVSDSSVPDNVKLLHIFVKVSFDNDSVVLEGYRTRYAPTSLP